MLALNNSRLELVLASNSDASVLSSGNPLPLSELIAIPQIADKYESMLVGLQNITIGTINNSGDTPVYDQNGNTINNKSVTAPITHNTL